VEVVVAEGRATFAENCNRGALRAGGDVLVFLNDDTTVHPMWLGPLVGLAVLAPWLLREWIVFGDPLVGVKQSAGQIPAYTVAVMPWHFYLQAIPFAASWPVAVAGLAGLAWAVARRQALGYYALAAIAVLIGWHTQYDFKSVRLMVPALPFLAIGVGLLYEALAGESERLKKGLTASVMIVALGLTGHASYVRVQEAFTSTVTLGQPSFLDAMEFLRLATGPNDVVMGSSVPQIHWYADRRAISLPQEEAEIAQLLDQTKWTILTSFERGQPAWLASLARDLRLETAPYDAVRTFDDGQFQTILLRSDWLAVQLEARSR